MTKTIRDITIKETIDGELSIPEFDYYKYNELKIPVELLMPEQYTQAMMLLMIYKQSVVDYAELYKMMALVSYKTSNDQEACENMPYWKFSNLTGHINDIMEQENGKGGDGSKDAYDQAESMKSGAMKNVSSTMKGATSSIPKMSTPKFNLPKF